MPIKIVIDSSSDISKEEAVQLGIEVIPMIVSFDKDEYYDGVDLTPKEFYEKLIESDVLPKTSQITPFRYMEVYERLVKEGYDVIVITLSSKLSNTYSSAVLASHEFEGKVKVVDSLNAAIGERLLCQLALKLVEDGLSFDEIVEQLEIMKHKINLIAIVDTLEYLKKGGRISKTIAFAGELLAIKPVISVVEGEVKVIGKARGSKNAKNLLNQMIMEKGGINFSLPFGAVYSGLSTLMLDKYIEDHRFVWEPYVDSVPTYIVGSTIGTHVGPGVLGVAFFGN